jgi:hypothetical protein
LHLAREAPWDMMRLAGQAQYRRSRLTSNVRRRNRHRLKPHPPMKTLRSSEDVVREFWRLMATNDFRAVSEVLHNEFVLEWPQSAERILRAERFARMNEEYPAHGPWRFSLQRLVAGTDQVVTDVAVTDGVQGARAISFFTVHEGKVLVEFWPEPYKAPENRAHLVEPLA